MILIDFRFRDIFFSIGKRWLGVIYAGCKEKQVEGKCSGRNLYQNMLRAAAVESTQQFFLARFWFGQPLI